MKNLFGAILQELRKDHKITQKDLADILGVTSKTISNYETGSQFPDLLIIIKLAEYFDVNMDYLGGRTRISSKWETIEKGLEVNNLNLNLDDLLTLNNEDKKLIISFIKRLRKQKAYPQKNKNSI